MPALSHLIAARDALATARAELVQAKLAEPAYANTWATLLTALGEADDDLRAMVAWRSTVDEAGTPISADEAAEIGVAA